jgi:hypothetical protein
MLGGGYFEVPSGTICPLAEMSWEEGSAFRFHYDSEEAPVADVPSPTPEHSVASEPGPSPSYEAPVEAAAPVAAAPQATEAQTLAPDPMTAASELQGLVGAAGGDSTLAIVLALVAVLGGGAAWKFYNQKSAQTHELKLKELELKAQQPSQSPPPCIVKHGELDAKLASVEGKVAKIDQKTAGMSVDGPSSDELDERIIKLERQVKALVTKKAVIK